MLGVKEGFCRGKEENILEKHGAISSCTNTSIYYYFSIRPITYARGSSHIAV